VESNATVYLVDDDERSRRHILKILGEAAIPVETSASGEELLCLLRVDSPGCVVIELSAGVPASVELRQKLHTLAFPQPVLILAEESQMLRVDPPHADHFVNKPIDPPSLIEAVRSSLQIDARNRAQAMERQLLKSRLKSLTDREREILNHMLEGHSVKRTSAMLNLSTRTVENHRKTLKKKLEVVSLAQLLRKLLPDLLEP
jgi:two-component system response regulator FixJ